MVTRTVELISTPDCQQCKATERVLQGSGIEYTKRDASQDADAARTAKGLGYQQAPVVLVKVDGKLLTHWGGFRPDNLKALTVSPASPPRTAARPRDIHANAQPQEPARSASLHTASL